MGRQAGDRAYNIIAADLASCLRARAEFFARNKAILRGVALATARSLARGGKLLLCGKDEDAWLAAMIAAAFIGGHEFPRPSLPAVMLGRPNGREDIYAAQVEVLGENGDVFLAICTGGNAPEILSAVDVARARGLRVIIFCNAGNRAAVISGALVAPTGRAPFAREILLAASHLYCRLVDYYLFENVAELFPAKNDGTDNVPGTAR